MTGLDALIVELRHRAGKAGGDAVCAQAATELERLRKAVDEAEQSRALNQAAAKISLDQRDIYADAARLAAKRIAELEHACAVLTDARENADDIKAETDAKLARVTAELERVRELMLQQTKLNTRMIERAERAEAERDALLRFVR